MLEHINPDAAVSPDVGLEQPGPAGPPESEQPPAAPEPPPRAPLLDGVTMSNMLRGLQGRLIEIVNGELAGFDYSVGQLAEALLAGLDGQAWDPEPTTPTVTRDRGHDDEPAEAAGAE